MTIKKGIAPETIEHRDIEIRFGYDIIHDRYIANFTLPEPPDESKSLRTELPFLQPLNEPLKYQVSDESVVGAIRLARVSIDFLIGK